MAIRMHLLFSCAALCILVLQNANAASINPFLEQVMPRLKTFSWKDCGSASDPAHIESADASPDPIKFPGNLTVSTKFTLTTGQGTDISLAIVMEKKVAGFFVKIPCIEQVGSCTYGDICTIWAENCPKFFSKFGIPCNCPIPANTYTVDGAVIDVTTALPGIADGDYRITGNLVSASSGHIACIQVMVSLSK